MDSALVTFKNEVSVHSVLKEEWRDFRIERADVSEEGRIGGSEKGVPRFLETF